MGLLQKQVPERLARRGSSRTDSRGWRWLSVLLVVVLASAVTSPSAQADGNTTGSGWLHGRLTFPVVPCGTGGWADCVGSFTEATMGASLQGVTDSSVPWNVDATGPVTLGMTYSAGGCLAGVFVGFNALISGTVTITAGVGGAKVLGAYGTEQVTSITASYAFESYYPQLYNGVVRPTSLAFTGLTLGPMNVTVGGSNGPSMRDVQVPVPVTFCSSGSVSSDLSIVHVPSPFIP